MAALKSCTLPDHSCSAEATAKKTTAKKATKGNETAVP